MKINLITLNPNEDKIRYSLPWRKKNLMRKKMEKKS